MTVDAMNLVRSLGGIARTRTLHARGVSDHHRRRLVADGRLERVARGWLALPGTDAALRAAAQGGVVLTCVTQASRLGLWVLEEDRPHVGAAPNAKVRLPRAHVHWARPAVPRHPDALVDPLENVLALIAACQPHEAALAVWESALQKGLMSLDVMRRLDLGPAGRRLCAEADQWADSGLETFVVPRLRWLGLRLLRQAWIARRRVDLLIGERLAFQIDGATHVGEQREADIRHDAELALLGYHVIRVGYRQIVDDWHSVQDHIMRAVAQGLHRA